MNPYDPPQQANTNGISRRQLIFGLLFGALVLGGVISYQALRFRQMEQAAAEAVMRAQAAEAQAEQAAREAEELKEQLQDQEPQK